VFCPTPDEIRLRAYFLWVAANRPAGDGVNFWLTAERELQRSKSYELVQVS